MTSNSMKTLSATKSVFGILYSVETDMIWFHLVWQIGSWDSKLGLEMTQIYKNGHFILNFEDLEKHISVELGNARSVF